MSENKKVIVHGGTTELLLKFMDDLRGVAYRVVGNAALTVGLRYICQALKAPAESEMEQIATQLAESAATWYNVAVHKTDLLPLRERLYAVPQKMSERIDYLLKDEWEVKEPKKEELEAYRISREEYIEIARAENKRKQSWLNEHRAEIETRWEALIVDNDGEEDPKLVPASTDIAGVILKKGIASARRSRVKALVGGWSEARSDLGALATFEDALTIAWKREGGRDDDLIE
jgi:hypothetical protein